MENIVLVQKKGPWGHLALNRPNKLNVLNLDIINELSAHLEALNKDSSIGMISLEGMGDKGFCAGGDVVAVINHDGDNKGQFFAKEYELDLTIHKNEKPIMAFVHGIVMGGGVGLINGASYRISDSKSLFAMPEITIGLFPDVGASFFLNQCPRSWSLFVALTGARLSASMAKSLGLIDHIVGRSSWDKLKEASDTKSLDTLIRECEESHLDYDHSSLSKVLAPLEEMTELSEFIDWAQAIPSDSDAWILSSVKTFFSGSLLSAQIIWDYFSWARGRSLEECFAKDLELGTMMIDDSDFREGVRALLIDKDKSPQWRYSTLDDLHQDSAVYQKFKNLF